MYRLTIWLIAAAFVFSGVASHVRVEPHLASAVIAQDDYGAPSVTGQRTESERVDTAKTADIGQPFKQHNCLKCCGTCNVASILSGTATAVTFSYAAITFRVAQHKLVGHLVALDPDIPKTIV